MRLSSRVSQLRIWALRLGFFVAMSDLRQMRNISQSVCSTFLSLLALGGCDKNQLAPIDSQDAAPVVRQLELTPDSIYIENLTPVNGLYTVSATVRATATDLDGAFDLVGVTVDAIRGDGSLAASGVALHDNGLSPDSVQDDGIFSGSIQF